ncbi:MAG: hypothetical protein AAGD96_23225 [Chloroflexota bacterium]
MNNLVSNVKMAALVIAFSIALAIGLVNVSGVSASGSDTSQIDNACENFIAQHYSTDWTLPNRGAEGVYFSVRQVSGRSFDYQVYFDVQSTYNTLPWGGKRVRGACRLVAHPNPNGGQSGTGWHITQAFIQPIDPQPGSGWSSSRWYTVRAYTPLP